MKRTAAEVSVRQIEIAYCIEKVCWSACIDGLTSIQRKNTAEIIKGRAVFDLL